MPDLRSDTGILRRSGHVGNDGRNRCSAIFCPIASERRLLSSWTFRATRSIPSRTSCDPPAHEAAACAAGRDGGRVKRSRRFCYPAKYPTLLTPEEAGNLRREGCSHLRRRLLHENRTFQSTSSWFIPILLQCILWERTPKDRYNRLCCMNL